MKVLITGGSGQLGYDLIKILSQNNIEHIGISRKDFDITDFNESKKFIENYRPNVIIHCAAYTNVDKAEEEKELCELINVQGTKNISSISRLIDSKFVYISTDYVFEGTCTKEYEIDDITIPINFYGQTKLKGEIITKSILDKYFIVRTSWIFGKNGNNFVKKILELGKCKSEIDVVCDQIGSPTYTLDLSILIYKIILTEKYGIYHITNEGICSWAQFAQEIFRQNNYTTKVNFISGDMYCSKVNRPKNSILSKKSLDLNGFKRLPSWENALNRYLMEQII